MSKEYDGKWTGVMADIQALIAPPGETVQKTEGLNLHPYFRRPGRGHNHDKCDACSEGGDLLCCDHCPASFHLGCHDPPISLEQIPLGDWMCHHCKATEALRLGARPAEYQLPDGHQPSAEALAVRRPLRQLVAAASLHNPQQFQLPPELVVSQPLPGDSRLPSSGTRSKATHEPENGLVPLPARLCHACGRSCRVAALLACDWCSACFHLDCLDPPLATMPSGSLWMCPLHAQHFIDAPLLTSTRFTERVKLWSRFAGPVDQETVKFNFLRRVHRKNPPFRRKIRIKNENLVEVPEAVKSHYRQPVSAPARAPLRNAQEPGTVALPERHEQDLWLSSVVAMQLREVERRNKHSVMGVSASESHDSPTPQGATDNRLPHGDAHPVDPAQFMDTDDGKARVITNGICSDNSDGGHGGQSHNGAEPAGHRSGSLHQWLAACLTDDGLDSNTETCRRLRARLTAAEQLRVDALEPDLVQLLAAERLGQLLGAGAVGQLAPRAPLDTAKVSASLVSPRAALSPLNGLGHTEYMRYRSYTIGSGPDNDLDLDRHGFCRSVSGHHATLFYDEACCQFELLNYSEHGTLVEGVLYGCRTPAASVDARSFVQSTVQTTAAERRRRREAAPSAETAAPSAAMSRAQCAEQRRCQCAPEPRRGGFETAATLQHGSALQFGCRRFVFAELWRAPAQRASVLEALQQRRRPPSAAHSAQQTQQSPRSESAQHTRARHSEPAKPTEHRENEQPTQGTQSQGAAGTSRRSSPAQDSVPVQESRDLQPTQEVQRSVAALESEISHQAQSLQQPQQTTRELEAAQPMERSEPATVTQAE